MSSHHFVKEGQEPAVFIVDPISLELIEPLLEWVPLVIILDSALDKVLSWGIKIDIVLTSDSQFEKIKEKVQEQDPIKIISYKSGEDPIATGLYFLIKNQQTDVTVIAESDNISIFSFIHNLSTKLHIVLLNKDLRWSSIAAGEYRKWFPAGVKVKIQGSQDEQEFSTQGINSLDSKWYSVEKDGAITIQSKSSFWIGEEMDTSFRNV